jgi:AcrR family transcriptional regulator
MDNMKQAKISLYSEIGQYFAPDGSFNPGIFSEVLKSHLEAIKKSAVSVEQFQQKASSWIERYVSNVVEYLNGKNMLEASYTLVKQTVDTCISFGINTISIPPYLLEKAFTQGFQQASKGDNDITDRQNRNRKTTDEKKLRIFEAALTVFTETAFHKATMDKIASMAGIGKGSLYRMFNSKEELLEQLLDHEYRRVVSHIGLIFANSSDLYDGLHEMIEFWVNYVNDNPKRYRLLLNTDIAVGSSSRTLFYSHMNKQLPMLKERIVSLNKDNKFKFLNFETVMYGIFGFIDGVVHKWMARDMSYPITNELPIILECIFNGYVSENYPREHFNPPVLSQEIEKVSG